MSVLHVLFALIRTIVADRAELAGENTALRQQLAIRAHRSKRPRLRNRDRIFWAWLSGYWSNWRSVLVIVQPDTVLNGHRRGFKLYRRWRSRKKMPGHPKIDAEIRSLIRPMSRENPTWGHATDPLRAASARLHRGRVNGGELHKPLPQAAFPDVANVARESCRRHRRGRFLRCPDGEIPLDSWHRRSVLGRPCVLRPSSNVQNTPHGVLERDSGSFYCVPTALWVRRDSRVSSSNIGQGPCL